MMKPTAWRSLFIASFVAATATCAAGREGVFPNPRPDRTWGRTAGGIFTSGKSIAVVIGISNYIGTRAGGYPALPTAKRDADKMADFLLNDAGFDTVYLLTDEDATKVKIDKLMTDVIPAVVTGRDRFLFYWSGHGDQRFSGDGRPFGFLPVADSKSKEFSGMVSMQDLERWDRYLDARQALFVLDACLSGLAGFQTKAPLNARLEQLSLPARHLITAGTKDEIVISGDRWGGSLFTDSFILGAKGQARSPSGIVSLPVLLDFIQERVARERELVNWSKSLTPQIQSLQHGEGYFFFTPVVPVGLPPAGATRQDIPEQKGFPVAVTPPPGQGERDIPPASVQAYLSRGIEYGKNNELDRAIVEFSEAIRLDPKHTLAFYNRGNAYAHKKDYDRAIADYSEAIRLDPGYPTAFYGRGIVYREMKDYDRAIADYNEAIRLDPNYAIAFANRSRAYGDKRDAERAYADYRQALLLDPRNTEYLGRTFLAALANGEVEEGVKLAERVLQVDKNDRIARLVLGVRAIKQRQYPLARRELAQSIRGPITDLVATLLSAWTMANPAEAKQATDSIDKLAGADWYAIFKELHTALILDAAGQRKDAAKHFERSYKLDPTALRVVQAYGSFLARQGSSAEALKVFTTFDEALPRYPLIVEAMNELNAGKRLPLMVDTPQAGAAEVLYGMGAVLGQRGGEDLGLIYLQLSLYLVPSHPLALLSLGDLYEAIWKKPELAAKTYERVPPTSPLHRNAQFQLAVNLHALDRTGEAKVVLEKLIMKDPYDLHARDALANITRRPVPGPK